MKILPRLFPFLTWPTASRASLVADLVAGVTVALLLVPQAIAYAQLAGLPASYGLYAAFIPTIIGGLFGSCHQLAPGPVALTSLVCFAVLADANLAPRGSEAYVHLAVTLAFLAGIIRLAIGLARLSWLVNFISHPVVVGFTNAAALIIAISQVNKLFGYAIPRSDSFLRDLVNLAIGIRHSHVMAFVLGFSAIAVIVFIRKIRPHWPNILIALILTTLVSWAIGYESAWNGEVAGTMARGLPTLTVPRIRPSEIVALLPGALTLAVIGTMEVVAISKAIAVKTRARLDLNQEIIGQGLANLLGSFAQSYPVSASLSRSALNLYVGAQSGLSSVFTGVTVMVALIVLTPLLHHLPQSVLAGIIIVTVFGLINFRTMINYWRASRYDGITAGATFLATLCLAPKIVESILLGAALAIVFYLYRTMKPHVAVLGRHWDGTFRDAHHHRLPVDKEVVILRFEGRLYFANTAWFEEAVLHALADFPTCRAILIVGDGINEIDASGAEKIRDLVIRLRENGIRLAFSELKWKVADILERTELHTLLGPENLFRSSYAAFDALKQGITRPESNPMWSI